MVERCSQSPPRNKFSEVISFPTSPTGRIQSLHCPTLAFCLERRMNVPTFVTPLQISKSPHRTVHHVDHALTTSHSPPRMQMQASRVSLYGGIGVLAAVLTNRIVLTPLNDLATVQARSDILGVITGAALVLYGVGKAEIIEKKKQVDMEGDDVRRGFSQTDRVSREIQWAAQALYFGMGSVKSCVIIRGGVGSVYIGKLRSKDAEANVREGGVVQGALNKGERAYLADMKVFPVKEVEFGFLPNNCQVSDVKNDPFLLTDAICNALC